MHWIDLGNGRRVLRNVRDRAPSARSDLPCPRITRDDIAPCISQADGKEYTSLSALRASYQPDGNPRREQFHEVPEFDPDHVKTGNGRPITDAEAADVADEALAAVRAGYVPEVVGVGSD